MYKHFLILSFLLLQFPNNSQVIVRGKVYHNGKGLKGAEVTTQSAGNLFLPITTDKHGTFEIKCSGKGDHLNIRKKGFIPRTVIIANDRPLSINLEKAPRKKIRIIRIKKHRSGCPPENPYCGCCFVKDTKVLLKDGTEKKIQNIKAGDVILNIDLKYLSIRADTVIATDSVIHDRLIEVELENKTIITSTPDHPYYVDGKGWCSYTPKITEQVYHIPCQQLELEDNCLFFNYGTLKPQAIKAIRRRSKKETTYNIRTRNKNYFANGILVSTEEL